MDPDDLTIDLRIETGTWPETVEAVAERAVALALKRAGVRIKGPVEISILLTGDAEQQALNRLWRGIDKPTNVLSFPQIEPFSPLSGPIGDLSLANETLSREAEALEISFLNHFSHLLVHGTLHLVGFDHETEPEAVVMERLETDILAELGIADPYAEPPPIDGRSDRING